MPDKKLTDSEIVNDLNEAKDLENVLLYCKNPNKEVMTPIKITDIRDLINRLQSQLLKEQNKNSKLRNERNHLQAENERLKSKCENTQVGYNFLKDELEETKKKKSRFSICY